MFKTLLAQLAKQTNAFFLISVQRNAKLISHVFQVQRPNTATAGVGIINPATSVTKCSCNCPVSREQQTMRGPNQTARMAVIKICSQVIRVRQIVQADVQTSIIVVQWFGDESARLILFVDLVQLSTNLCASTEC